MKIFLAFPLLFALTSAAAAGSPYSAQGPGCGCETLSCAKSPSVTLCASEGKIAEVPRPKF